MICIIIILTLLRQYRIDPMSELEKSFNCYLLLATSWRTGYTEDSEIRKIHEVFRLGTCYINC